MVSAKAPMWVGVLVFVKVDVLAERSAFESAD